MFRIGFGINGGGWEEQVWYDLCAVRTVLWKQPWVVKKKVCGGKVKEEVA